MTKHHKVFLGGGALALVLLGTQTARADEKGETLLKEVEAASKAVKTLSADLTMSYSAKDAEGKGQPVTMAASVKLKKPNLARIEFSQGQFTRTFASDGKTFFTLMPNGQYQKSAADPTGKNLTVLWAAPINMFFSGRFASLNGELSAPTYVGKQNIDGTDYEVVQMGSTKPLNYTAKLYIAPSKLMTRLEMQLNQDKKQINYAAALQNIKLNATLSDTAFAYVPPKDATPYQAPSIDDLNNKLLAVNSVAPPFALSTPVGGKLTLEDALKNKKAVLVNFWFYG